MQIYLSLMSQKNPSSDSSSYDLSSPQGRMLYVRETTNAAFSSWTSPLQRQDPDTQEEKKQEMLSRIMGKLKSGKKLSAKELDFLRRTDPILYAHALRVQRMAEDAKKRKTNNPNAHFSDGEDTHDDTDDLLSWTPRQEIIDAAPTLECQG